ncbi:MerR family transcriptional regulator [Shouchella shacheensis]|uniref:MerR family transcriptional regulator n=1 Tax=Shouchella shacheensis TaxID=1649580 RepID=UPI000740453A|nr:MerR family transcriptional regulator [Shouchella shacheensis]
MEYTVKKLAGLAGVSARTLRYYDEIGLLKPARINASGYRIYGQQQVNLLQQILFYRELDVSLETIRSIVNKPSFDEQAALKKHYQKLIEKRTRLDQLIAIVEKTMATKEGGQHMTDNEKFAGFKEGLISENEAKYGNEIREKYGDETIDNANMKLKGMSEDEYAAMKALEKELFTLLEQAYETGDPASSLGQKAAEVHKQWLLYSWSSYSKDAHAGIAEMYVADERFTSYYDNVARGGTAFLRDAILIYLGKSESKKPREC